MDVVSALVGGLFAVVGGVAVACVNGLLSKREQAAKERHEHVQRAEEALRELRSAYVRAHHDADAPPPVVLADLETGFDLMRRRQPTIVRDRAARYVIAGQAYARRLPGSTAVQEAAYDALATALIPPR